MAENAANVLEMLDTEHQDRKRIARVFRQALHVVQDQKCYNSAFIILEGPSAITVVRESSSTYCETIGKLEYLKARIWKSMFDES